MGRLKPGADYVYERVDNVIYAREFGADPSTRIEVGRDYSPSRLDPDPLRESLRETQLWHDIRRAAKTNSALQDALNQVIELYHLIKKKHG